MQKWEYLFVWPSYSNNAARPFSINGNEPKDWEKGPTIYEFANQMGEQGWELVSSDGNTLYLMFKRPKE